MRREKPDAAPMVLVFCRGVLPILVVLGAHNNELADDLSKNRHSAFWEKNANMDTKPSIVPSSLLQWLLQHQPEWSSPSWIQQFASFARREWLTPPTAHTHQH